MSDPRLRWNKCTTLSKQIVRGQPTAKEFLWATDLDGNIHIKSKRTSQVFSRKDYQAMISHISTNSGGVPLGARHDDKVPENSIGALMERRRGTQSIRGWCSHLAAIAVEQVMAIPFAVMAVFPIQMAMVGAGKITKAALLCQVLVIAHRSTQMPPQKPKR